MSTVADAAARIAPHARAHEVARQLTPEALAALDDAGVWTLLVERALGGTEAPVPVFLDAIETIARADAAAGWVTMIVASSGLMAGFLAPEVARAIFAPGVRACGVFAPIGRASRVDGGYRVSGRWPFASGCRHAHWIMGGGIAADAPTEPRGFLFPAADVTIHDTWDTLGLRGTGSHDIEVADVFVPAERSYPLVGARHRVDGYRGFFGILASGIAAVTLGIGRAALDAAIALAAQKKPMGARRAIAERETVQQAIAIGEARLAAARALLHAASTGGGDLDARARLRLAACHAATESAAVVEAAYGVAGATAIHASHPLQRHVRDVHTATQHVMVAPITLTTVGRVLLGVETDTSTL